MEDYKILLSYSNQDRTEAAKKKKLKNVFSSHPDKRLRFFVIRSLNQQLVENFHNVFSVCLLSQVHDCFPGIVLGL